MINSLEFKSQELRDKVTWYREDSILILFPATALYKSFFINGHINRNTKQRLKFFCTIFIEDRFICSSSVIFK